MTSERAAALGLPTCDITVDVHQHDRLTLIVQDGVVVNVLCSVLRPARDAEVGNRPPISRVHDLCGQDG